jgi:hypothetical protein
MLSTFFPVSGEDLVSVRHINRAAENEMYRFLDHCLEGEGFALSFESTIPPDWIPRFQAFPAYGSLRKYGFNMARPPGFPAGFSYLENVQNALDGLVPLPADVSKAEARALVDAYKDCGGRFDQEMSVALWELRDVTYVELIDGWQHLVAATDRGNASIRTAFKEFDTCIEKRGWRPVLDGILHTSLNDDPFFAALDVLYLGEPDPDKARALELRAASDYADCMASVEVVRFPIRMQLRATYVEDHFADMLELEGAFREALGELGLGPLSSNRPRT